MSPVMAKALVDVSAAVNQGPSAKKKRLRLCRSRGLCLGTALESKLTFR